MEPDKAQKRKTTSNLQQKQLRTIHRNNKKNQDELKTMTKSKKYLI